MKVAVSVCILFAVLCVDFACELSMQEFERWHEEWLSIFCTNTDENLNKEKDECMKKGVENVGAVVIGCMKEVDPDFKDTFTFRQSACPGTDMYAKFKNCLANHAEDSDFLRKVEESTEALNCLYGVMEKYGKMNEDLKLRTNE